MTSDMNKDDLTRLETELRDLPPPPLPADLEEKLLAAIPQCRGRIRWPRIYRLGLAGAVAASLIVAFGLHLLRVPTRPAIRPVAVDATRILEREAFSARLNAAAQILADQPGGETFAEQTYRYLAQAYPDTTVGKQLSMRRNEL